MILIASSLFDIQLCPLSESRQGLRLPITAGEMTERHLRCGVDGCHFTSCCRSRHDRLGCLRHHIIWHLNKWDKACLLPSSTTQLLDELEFENDKLWGATPKNENAENEIEVSNSSCDGDNAPNDNGTKVQRNNGTKVQHNNGTKVQRYDGTTNASCWVKQETE